MRLATLLQIAGLVALSAAGFVVTLWLGLAIAGVSLVVSGVALERD
jgi:hypothetical protein